jgi:fibronectin type III domain protein/galactose oxidase-like protein
MLPKKWNFIRMNGSNKFTNKGANSNPHRGYTTAQLVLLVGLVYLALATLSGCSGGTSSESIQPVASTCVHPSSNGSPPTNSLISPRANYTATLLPSGKVLVAGGAGNTGPLRSAELYDPAIGLWTPTGSLTVARFSHTATLLLNGKVLVAGGFGSTGQLTSAEIVTPSNGIQAKLSWDPPNGFPVTGYKVYYGTASKTYQQAIDVGLTTTYAFSSLNGRTTYYFSVTSYNNSGAESCATNEVVKTTS